MAATPGRGPRSGRPGAVVPTGRLRFHAGARPYPRPADGCRCSDRHALEVDQGIFSVKIRGRLGDVGSPLLERLIVRERPGVDRFRFWQEGGGYDRDLRSTE